jgi:ABC-type multidrug transport system fused ATPase/permease subunit
MKLLLQAALRSRHHLSLAIFTCVALLGLTIANQLEMFALGIISNTGMVDHAQAIDRPNPLSMVIAKIKVYFALDGNFTTLIVMLIFVAIFKATWLFASRYMSQILAIRVSRDLRKQYFEHIQLLPMSFYQEHNVGGLSSRVVSDANQISTSLNSLITNVLQVPFTLLTTLALCFFHSWQLSLVIFFGLPMIILPMVVLARRVKRVSRQLQKNQEKFASVLFEFLGGIQTVKIFAMELFSLKKYQAQNEKMAFLEAKTAKYGLLTRPILHAITTTCLAGVVIIGLHVLHMSLSTLVVFCGLLYLLYEPVKKFAEENASIQRGVVAANRMFEVLHLTPTLGDQPNAVELKSFEKSLEFDHVWFRYHGEWVLKDLSFSVKKGETVAIVGATGAGKSTVVQLIPRLFDVQKGEIRIDGRSIRDYTQKSLREQIAFVSQKPFFFLDTIEANISYGTPATFAEIRAAAKGAFADEFIERLPAGYSTMLAEGGQNLSGGQQQRLAIARALFKNAPLLILDEATSSLDAISEWNIQQATANLHGVVTQILIAHRLTTIEHADRIIFLEKGEKIAEGTIAELLVTCPQFRSLWEMHFRADRQLEQGALGAEDFKDMLVQETPL